MNKKLNTVLFVLAASVFNIFLMVVFLLAGLALLGTFAGESIGEGAATAAFLAIFIGAIAGAFFVYHRIVRLISRKIDMDAHFHPLFRRRK